MKIIREPGEVILVQRTGRDQDPTGPDDLPQRAFQGGMLDARIGPAVRPGRGIKVTQPITRPPQLGLGQQPQIGFGPLLAHAPSLHHARPGNDPAARDVTPEARPSPGTVTLVVEGNPRG